MSNAVQFLDHLYVEFDNNRKVGPAMWPHFDLFFLHKGEIHLTLKKKESIYLQDNQSILIYPNTPFKGESISKITKTSIQHFKILPNEQNLPLPLKNISNKSSGFQAYNNKQYDQVEKYIHKAIEFASLKQTSLIYDIRISMLTFILGLLLITKDDEHLIDPINPKFNSLINWLKDNKGKKILLEDMASYMNLSKSHFRALFKESTGTTPGAFLMMIRMTEADRLLRETVMPIKQVASMVGYPEVCHFYRAFKSFFEVPPNVYRKEQRPKG